jgi:outer membrane autotransporter protein
MRMAFVFVGRAAMFGLAIAAFIPSLSSNALAGCGPTVVTSISPTGGPAAGGTSVTITGSGFSCAKGNIDAVTFGSTTAISATFVSDTEIDATSPPGTGTVDVRVTVNGSQSAIIPGDRFTYAATGPQPDSLKAHALQVVVSPIVAQTSGAAITSAIDGGITDGFSNGGTPASFGPGGGFINFAAEPRSQTATRAEEAFAALGYAGNVYKAPPRKPLLYREWNAWADIRGTGWKANDTSGNGNDLKGNQINLTAGLGRRLNLDTLVGMVVGYEYFKYDVAALAGTLKGDGETIGGYFARRFGNLRFDAALAWSNVNYSAAAGAATGAFKGSRWLASTGLTGTHKFGSYVLEPSAKLFILWERQTAWIDSLGTAQDARNFSAGRTAIGAKVARPFVASNGWTISPYAGLYGDWRFSSDNALPTGTPVANIKDGWSARVTSGLSATVERGTMVSLGGELGGLGASYKIWSGNVRATVPF